MGASFVTERFNREQYSEETVTSVTGNELSRARSMIVFDVFSLRFRAATRVRRAATKGLLAFVGVIRDALGHEDELFLVPVAS